MNSSLVYVFQGIAADNALIFHLWYRMRRKYRRLMVGPNTGLVVEGFPRCANSFAVVAFESVQTRPVVIAHHLHAEVQVQLGIKFGIPVLVVCREPIGAVTSLITRHPSIGVGQALRRYIRFYESIMRVREGFVLADFNEITDNYADVIRRLNVKFGTEFNLYHNLPERDKNIFRILDELNEKDAGGKENMVARPTERKAQILERKRSQIIAHRLIGKALEVYRKLNR